MSRSPDPTRWCDQLEELPPELRSALTNHVQRAPVPSQRARMAERLASVQAPATSDAAPTVANGGKLLGWVGGTLGVALALMVAVWLTQPRAEAPRPRRAAPVSDVHAPPPAAPPAPAPKAGPTSEVAPAPEVAPSPEPAPKRVAFRARPAEQARSRGVDPGAELRLLTPARQLVAVDAARALALTDEHARLFPAGLFAEERAVLRLEALARLGRGAALREGARAFMQRYPRSVHSARVNELVTRE